MVPLGGVVIVNLRIRFSESRAQFSDFPNNLPIAVLFMSLCSVYPASSFPHEESKLVTGPFLTLHPICRGFIASLMVGERSINVQGTLYYVGISMKLLDLP